MNPLLTFLAFVLGLLIIGWVCVGVFAIHELNRWQRLLKDIEEGKYRR